jgi:hypothetical protein
LTLRTLALVGALIVLVAMLASGDWSGENWPAVVLMVAICAAFAIQRRQYGRAIQGQPGPGWTETGEQFVDDASGDLVRVWYKAETGERRYVAVNPG